MSESISKVIGARKGVVTKLLNRVHKFIDEDSIRLVNLEDFINQLKEKCKRIIEAWLPLEQRFEDGETIKDYDSISQSMDLFEDQYQDGLAKILKHINLLSARQTAKTPVGPIQIRLPKVKLVEFHGDITQWELF